MEEKENFIKGFMEYEAALGQFFKELGLKPAQRELVRAFILASKGEKVFEASYADLANLQYKKSKSGSRTDSKMRNALKGLLKWQDENQIELVRVLRKGQRAENRDQGRFDYIKPKYELVILDELVKILYSNSEDLEAEIQRLLADLKTQYQAPEPKRLSPRRLLSRAKKTIYAKLKKVFELAVKVGINPQEECQTVLNNSWQIYQELDGNWTDKQNKEAFMAAFDKQFE